VTVVATFLLVFGSRRRIITVIVGALAVLGLLGAAVLLTTRGDDEPESAASGGEAPNELDGSRAYLATPPDGGLTVYEQPSEESVSVAAPAPAAELGGFFVAAPYDAEDGWLKVFLPDGATRWIRPDDADVEPVNVVGVATATAVDTTGGGGGEVPVYVDASTPTPNITVANPLSADGLKVAPVTFLVKGPYDPTATRLEVELPVRPNGTTGWVDAAGMAISANRFRVQVALTDHTIQVFDGSDVVFEEPIGVGTTDTPTPGGTFYIRSLIASTDPAYGTYAFGLSGFSEVHETFNGGPGDIGIHGTSDPSTIGTDVSNGCIRLTDEAVIRLAGLLPEAQAPQSPEPEITTGLGVPVTVLA
jgi:lipoprotein-anchoring transpeptidase ErfK/SrfK